MRSIVRLTGVAGALMVAACSGKELSSDDGFKKDLELASSASPITLQTSQAGAQVTSAIERTTPPAPRRAAPSQRVAKHVPALRGRLAPVEVEQADMSDEVVAGPVEIFEAPAGITPLPSPRPYPVATSDAGRNDGEDIGRAERVGSIISVVLRGGHGGIDECDPRTDGRRGGRRGGTIAINNRIPVIGTFPGRIQGTFPGGRLTASLPSGGRVRF